MLSLQDISEVTLKLYSVAKKWIDFQVYSNILNECFNESVVYEAKLN